MSKEKLYLNPIKRPKGFDRYVPYLPYVGIAALSFSIFWPAFKISRDASRLIDMAEKFGDKPDDCKVSLKYNGIVFFSNGIIYTTKNANSIRLDIHNKISHSFTDKDSIEEILLSNKEWIAFLNTAKETLRGEIASKADKPPPWLLAQLVAIDEALNNQMHVTPPEPQGP